MELRKFLIHHHHHQPPSSKQHVYIVEQNSYLEFEISFFESGKRDFRKDAFTGKFLPKSLISRSFSRQFLFFKLYTSLTSLFTFEAKERRRIYIIFPAKMEFLLNENLGGSNFNKKNSMRSACCKENKTNKTKQ